VPPGLTARLVSGNFPASLAWLMRAWKSALTGANGIARSIWPMGDARREPRLTAKAMRIRHQPQNSEEPVAWNGSLGAVRQLPAAGALCPEAYATGD